MGISVPLYGSTKFLALKNFNSTEMEENLRYWQKTGKLPTENLKLTQKPIVVMESINYNPFIMINREKNPTLKLLPCGARKSQIVQMYPREPEGYLRKLIHSIQVETNPHLSVEAAKNRKRLSRRELEKLVDVLGVPRGYQNKFMDA